MPSPKAQIKMAKGKSKFGKYYDKYKLAYTAAKMAWKFPTETIKSVGMASAAAVNTLYERATKPKITPTSASEAAYWAEYHNKKNLHMAKRTGTVGYVGPKVEHTKKAAIKENSRPSEVKPKEPQSEMKRARTMSMSTLSSSATGWGESELGKELYGCKTEERVKRKRGYYKSRGYGLKDIVSMLSPTWHVCENLILLDASAVPKSNLLDSVSGSQLVFNNMLYGFCNMFTRQYLEAIYKKLIYEINTLVNPVTNAAGLPTQPTSALAHNLFPDLKGYGFERAYECMNTGQGAQTITVIEYLCNKDCDEGPAYFWGADLSQLGTAVSVSTQTYAPTYTATSLTTDVGRRPSGRTLREYWSETRRTSYDTTAGQTIRHIVKHPVMTFPARRIFMEPQASVSNQSLYLKGITRSFMFITTGQKGLDDTGTTGTSGTNNGKLLVMPSYWNAVMEQECRWKAPIRQKEYHRSNVTLDRTGDGWSGSATTFRDFDATSGSAKIIDSDGRTAIFLSELDPDGTI